MTLHQLSDAFWQFSLWVNSVLSTAGCLITIALLFCLLALLRTARHYRLAVEAGRLVEIQCPPDMAAVAGEDVLTAQLDLARAYIEMGNQDEATIILARVAGQGTALQQQEVERLRSEIH